MAATIFSMIIQNFYSPPAIPENIASKADLKMKYIIIETMVKIGMYFSPCLILPFLIMEIIMETKTEITVRLITEKVLKPFVFRAIEPN